MTLLLKLIHFFTGCEDYVVLEKYPFTLRHNSNYDVAIYQISHRIVEHVVKSKCQCTGCNRIFFKEEIKLIHEL